MKKQNRIFLIVFLIFIFILTLFLIAPTGIFSRFNFQKVSSFTVGEYTFSLYGYRDTARKLKIEQDGKKLGKFDFPATVSELPDDDKRLILWDADGNGVKDLFVATGKDGDGDLHYRLFFLTEDGTCVPAGDIDFANPTPTSDGFVCIETIFRETADPEKNESVPYEKISCRREFSAVDCHVTENRCITLTYYSETDIYCFSVAEYDAESGELGYPIDKWYSPERYEKVAAELAVWFDPSLLS